MTVDERQAYAHIDHWRDRAIAAEASLAEAREALRLLIGVFSEWFAGDIPPQVTGDFRFKRAALASNGDETAITRPIEWTATNAPDRAVLASLAEAREALRWIVSEHGSTDEGVLSVARAALAEDK